jgi:hypothetical protein
MIVTPKGVASNLWVTPAMPGLLVVRQAHSNNAFRAREEGSGVMLEGSMCMEISHLARESSFQPAGINL